MPNWLKNNDKSQQQQQSALDITDITAAHEDELPDDHCSHLHGSNNSHTNSHTISNGNSNGSCTDISSVVKPFNRSKSNIETNFTSQPKIISTTNAAVAAMSVKAKTLSNHHHHQHHLGGSDRGQADGGSNQQDSDFDEFSSQDEDEEPEKQLPPQPIKTPNPLQTQHFYQNAQDLQKSQRTTRALAPSWGAARPSTATPRSSTTSWN